MRIRHLFAAAALGLGAFSLSGCATGLNTKVTRYQPASIPAGYSFYVVPKQGEADPRFLRYAAMVSHQLQSQGFRPAQSTQAADMLVRIGYGVDDGETVIESDPFYGSRYGWGRYGYYDPWYSPYWGVYGRPYYSRWSRYPFYYGWNDGFYGSRISSYTVYKSELDMDIVQRATNAPLFEGHARARSQSDDLDALVPNLITAMFTGFPGRNGETVRITIPNTPRR